MTDGLLQYATPTQARYLKALEAHGSIRKAAKALGLHHSAMSRSLQRLRATAARVDPSLHSREAPPGYLLRGVSTLVDANGNPRQQWIKTSVDREAQLEILKGALGDLLENGRGRLPPLRAPKQTDGDLLAVYPLADAHVGMLAWAEEAGEDFDLDIAERMYAETVDRLVASVPPAKSALLINLGDFFHVDNSTFRTERGGNVLDGDSRFAKIARIGLKIKRRMIDRLLQKHKAVEVWTLAGNHDENSGLLLAIALQAIYEKEPRLTVSVNPSRFQARKFGEVLVAAAHGHTLPLDRLPGVMAATWAEDWGATRYRVWYTGHVHHDSVKEHSGCTVETLRTLAPKDAWHAGAGYNSGRDMKCDLWHLSDGRVARYIQRAV